MEFPLQFTAPVVADASESSEIVDAVTLHGHGSMDRIKIQGTPLPVELKEDHVEVIVYHCGVNFTDNYLRLGIIRNTEFPVIMGSECAGVVNRVGSEVTKVKEGQTVLCLKMHGGLFRRKVHVPQTHCFPFPEDVLTSSAVALGLSSLMAYVCLFEVGGLEANQSVFMQSIGGGVGTSVIQLAKSVPNVTIMGTYSKTKREELMDLGAHHVFLDSSDWKKKVWEICPEGVDLVINSSGGESVEECLILLSPFGKLILIGSNSTCIYPKSTTWGFKRPTWDAPPISTFAMVACSWSVAGVNIGRFIDTEHERVAEILEDMFNRHKSGSLEPVFASFVPLERADLALSQMCMRNNVGKKLLTVRHFPSLRGPDDALWKKMDRSRSEASRSDSSFTEDASI